MATPDEANASRRGVAQEHIIRMAPVNDLQNKKMFLGNFPLGVPKFTEENCPQWKLYKEKLEGTRVKNASEAAWMLEDKPGHLSHRGVKAEPTANSGYFVLTRSGQEFIAHPISEWFNFRPVVQHEVLPLEEAEEMMRKKQRPRVSRAVSERLKQIAQKQESSGSLEEGLQHLEVLSDDSDFDEEREGKRRKKTKRVVDRPQPEDQHGSDSDQDVVSEDEDGGEKLRPDNVEDWEFEEDVADDDVNMGELDAGDEEVEQEYRRFVGSDSDEEAEELNESGRRLKKLLKKTGLDDSESEDEPEGANGTGKGSKMQVKDVDANDSENEKDNGMEVEIVGQGPTKMSQEKVKNLKKNGQKRKDSGATRPSSEVQPQQKKARTVQDTPAQSQVPKKLPTAKAEQQKNEGTSRNQQDANKKASGSKVHARNPYAERVKEFLQRHGPVPLPELIQEFKKSVETAEDRTLFVQGVQKVAKSEPLPNSKTQILSLKE